MGPTPTVPLDTLRAHLSEGWSIARIAKHLGVNISSVYRACYRHGILAPKVQAPASNPAVIYRDPMAGVRYGVSAEAARAEPTLYVPRFFEWRTNV